VAADRLNLESMPVYNSLEQVERQEEEYDQGDWMERSWVWGRMSTLLRAESMNIANDPRFFAGNVMDKRLSAFKVLTIVNSVMFGTALSQTFALKKDMDFTHFEPLVGNVAVWQLVSFFLCAAISVMCLISLYIIAHQLFYSYRLMTAGPSGFDQAAIFYLTRSITMWRHLAIKFLFRGLLMFLLVLSVQLLVKFYKDADKVKDKVEEVVIMNLQQGQSMQNATVHFYPEPKLSMAVHVGIGYVALFMCVFAAGLMIYIRKQHLAVFHQNYEYCCSRTSKVTNVLRDMSYRSGYAIET